jgi:hypothetical protein
MLETAHIHTRSSPPFSLTRHEPGRTRKEKKRNLFLKNSWILHNNPRKKLLNHCKLRIRVIFIKIHDLEGFRVAVNLSDVKQALNKLLMFAQKCFEA